MSRIHTQEIKRIVGVVTDVSPDEIGASAARVCQNYSPDPLGNVKRRAGSQPAGLLDNVGNTMNGSWFTSNWGTYDVENLIILPPGPQKVYTPGPKRADQILLGGGGKAEQGTLPASPERRFSVAIPAAIANGNPFNCTVTAQKKDGAGNWTTDTAWSGPVTLDGHLDTSGIPFTFTQITAAATVTWPSGIATISCQFDASAAPLYATAGCWCWVKAFHGLNVRGTVCGSSNKGWLTAQGYLVLAVSAASVPVGTAFNLICTAKKANGAVDISYFSRVDITDNNTPLSLVYAATGGAFTRFFDTDFVNGVATVSVKWSGTISATQTVIVSGVQNGAALPKGQVSQAVTASTLDSVAFASCSEVHDNAPTTSFPKALYSALSAQKCLGGAEYSVFLKLASSMQSIAGLVSQSKTSGPLFGSISGRWPHWHYYVAAGLRIYVDVILTDFTPSAMTWNNQGTLTYENIYDSGNEQGLVAYGGDFAVAYAGNTLAMAGAICQAICIKTPASAFYGLRIRVALYDYTNGGTPEAASAMDGFLGLIANQTKVLGKVV